MKNTLLASITMCCLPALVFAAQTPVTPMGAFANPASASINTLKAATNTKFEVIEANRQDHVSVLATKADKSSTIVEWSTWPNGTQFVANTIVSYQGSLYKCLQPYTKNSGDTPATFTAYWSVTGVTSYTALTDKPTIPVSLADLLADATHRVVTDAEKTTWSGKANTSSFASALAFQAAFGWSPSGTFDTAANQTITGNWAFPSGIEASNISLNLGTLADLKIGNAQMVDDTKGNGDTNFLWSADKIFDNLATKQPIDADLTTIAALSCASGQVIKFNGSSWACADDTGGSGSFTFDTFPTYEDSAHTSGIAVNGTTLAVYSATAGKWLTVELLDTLGATPSGIIDNFSSDTSANYTAINGSIVISGGVLKAGSAWTDNIAYHETPTGSNDHFVQGDIQSSPDVSGGLIGLRCNGTTGYLATIYQQDINRIVFSKFNGATVTTVANVFAPSMSLVSGNAYTVKITASGSTFHFYVDLNMDGDFSDADEDLGTVTDATYTTGQYIVAGARVGADTSIFTVDNLSGGTL